VKESLAFVSTVLNCSRRETLAALYAQTERYTVIPGFLTQLCQANLPFLTTLVQYCRMALGSQILYDSSDS
jgi:hypothetical protein